MFDRQIYHFHLKFLNYHLYLMNLKFLMFRYVLKYPQNLKFRLFLMNHLYLNYLMSH